MRQALVLKDVHPEQTEPAEYKYERERLPPPEGDPMVPQGVCAAGDLHGVDMEE